VLSSIDAVWLKEVTSAFWTCVKTHCDMALQPTPFLR